MQEQKRDSQFLRISCLKINISRNNLFHLSGFNWSSKYLRIQQNKMKTSLITCHWCQYLEIGGLTLNPVLTQILRVGSVAVCLYEGGHKTCHTLRDGGMDTLSKYIFLLLSSSDEKVGRTTQLPPLDSLLLVAVWGKNKITGELFPSSYLLRLTSLQMLTYGPGNSEPNEEIYLSHVRSRPPPPPRPHVQLTTCLRYKLDILLCVLRASRCLSGTEELYPFINLLMNSMLWFHHC